MKKRLSIFLAAILLMSVFSVFAAETENAVEEPVVYSEDIKILNSFGLFDAGFFANPKNAVTRGELAYVLDVMSNNKLVFTETQYDDVPSDHKYLSSIESAYQLGAMIGFVDGKFRPDVNTTYEQVFKTMVVLTGYSVAAEASSYTDVAMKLGITSGVKGNGTAAVTFEELAKIIRNTFEVQKFEVSIENGGLSFEIRENAPTYLEETFDIYTDVGTVDATYISSVNSNVLKTSEKCFVVNGRKINQADYNMELYLGYQLAFYYHVNSLKENDLLYVFDAEKYNSITTVLAQDIVSVSGGVLRYKSGKTTKSQKVKNSGDIIVNGILQNVYSDNIFNIKNGEINIVTNLKNNRTFFSVKDVREFTVSMVGTEAIITTTGQNISLGGEEKTYTEKITRAGKVYSLEKVKENDVIEILTDGILFNGNVDLSNANFVVGTVTTEKITGALNAVSDDYVEIEIAETGKVKYEYSATLKKNIGGGYVDAAKISKQYDFFLNSFGEIAFYSEKAETNDKAGILLRIGSTNGAFDSAVLVEILESDGKATVFELPEKITLEGKDKQDSTNLLSVFSSLSESVTTEDGGTVSIVKPHNRIIRYTYKEDITPATETTEAVTVRTITGIDTVKPNDAGYEEKDMTCEYIDNHKRMRIINSMVGNVFRTTGAVFFTLPKVISNSVFTGIDLEDPENYTVGYSTYYAQAVSGWIDEIYAYAKDEEQIVKATAVYGNIAGSSKISDLDSNGAHSRITDVIQMLYEDEPVTALVFSNNKTVPIKPGEETEVMQCLKKSWKDDAQTVANMAQVGDYVRYWTDVQGYLLGLTIAMPLEQLESRLPAINTYADGSAVNYQDQYTTRFLYGMAYYVGSSTITVAKKASKNDDGTIVWDFGTGTEDYSSELNRYFEHFPAGTTYYLLEEDASGQYHQKSATKADVRSYEHYGTKADMVLITSGYGGISSVRIVRPYNP